MLKKALFTLSALLLMNALPMQAANVKSGETIAFLGDSITQQGHTFPAGYVNLVMLGLKVNGINANMVKAGISGHKSNNMLARLERDVISKKPQIMTLSCGVNDVWHGARGVKLEDYKKNIREIVEKAQAAGIRVYIMTSTMIGEDPNNANNQKLAAYNKFLKELAAEKNLPLIDLNAVMQKTVAEMKKQYPGVKDNFLTTDGVHMAPAGNMVMAAEILNAFGFSEAEIAKAETEWLKCSWNARGIGSFSVKDFCTIQHKLWKEKKTINSYIYEKVQELLK